MKKISILYGTLFIIMGNVSLADSINNLAEARITCNNIEITNSSSFHTVKDNCKKIIVKESTRSQHHDWGNVNAVGHNLTKQGAPKPKRVSFSSVQFYDDAGNNLRCRYEEKRWSKCVIAPRDIKK